MRRLHPVRVVIAVPVGAADACRELALQADEVVCAAMPTTLHAVGLWYDDFSQTTDEQVRDLLANAERAHESRAAVSRATPSPSRRSPT